MQEEILDFLRNPFLVIYVSCLLSFCVVSGSQIGDAVELEFQAFRMHQYEVNGNPYGSKNFKIQYEAVSLDSSVLRRCVVALWRDIATKDIDALLSSSVGSLLIVIPADLDALSAADRTLFTDMERRLATVKSELAIYVVQSNEKILSVLGDVSSSNGKAATATQQLLNSVSANTFQFTSTGSYAGAPLTYTPQNVIGRLQGSDAAAPTIIFVAHYDSHSVFPALSVGADSNGSGIVMLLELLAIISRFYENPATRPTYNLVFAWTAGGKYNYQGTRAFIDSIQNGNIIDNDKVELAICIDSVGGPGNLHLHASKQPSEGSAASQLLRRLKLSAPNQSVELVTKKINLNAPMLSWEHERFNIKRMPAVTLSRLSNPDDSKRVSMLDTPAQISLDNLERNIRTVAEAVLGYILALPDTGFSSDDHVTSDSSVLPQDAVDRQRLAHFVRQFAQKPRPMCDETATKTAASNIAAAVGSITKSVSVEPVQLVDVQVWGGASDKLLAEQVKPAVFELFVSAFVIALLAIVYHVVSHAQRSIDFVANSLRKRV